MKRPVIAACVAVGLAGAAAMACAEGAMITQQAAREAATRALATHEDPAFVQWPALSAEDPKLVYDIAGPPAYWVAPLVTQGHVVGFARVLPDGNVAAIGLTCRTPRRPDTCPLPGFALSVTEVDRIVADSLSLDEAEDLTAPRLVHDGPHGHDVWLVETRTQDKPVRWVFVSEAGMYERPAGVLRGADTSLE